jgi:DNA polymerase-1
VNQHAEIKKYYTKIIGKAPASTDKTFLKKRADEGDELAVLIGRIRRLDKWKSTYIERILENSAYDGRFYTQFNQFNTVSGRFSGDAQQFPKDPIYTQEGYEYERVHKGHTVPDQFILYHPRRAFTGHIYYLDYSQIELRVQAHYTLFLGGDTNLCRAYMPFGCHHVDTGKTYNHDTPESRAEWDLKDKNDNSAWLDENNEPWKPTDVHAATTWKALIAMGYDPNEMDAKDLSWWRKKGKTFNFMRKYAIM